MGYKGYIGYILKIIKEFSNNKCNPNSKMGYTKNQSKLNNINMLTTKISKKNDTNR